MNLIEYRRNFLTLHGASEKYARGVIRAGLNKQRDGFIQAIRKHGVQSLTVAARAIILDNPLRPYYNRLYSRIGVEYARLTYKDVQDQLNLEVKAGITFYSAQWRRQMIEFMLSEGGVRISEVDGNTLNKIQLLLASAQEQGLTQDETSRYMILALKNDINPSNPFNKVRVQRIARTETTTAANRGLLIASDSLTITTLKKWVYTKDNRTRPDHVRVGTREPIPLDQPYLVGGEEMQQPGDINASAKQCVNCRCFQRLVPVQ